MTHTIIVLLSVLGVIGQVLAGLLILVVLLRLFGVRAPFDVLRADSSGYELWFVFVVAAIATTGSLYFSESAGFIPCELCWFQRICMYPLVLVLLPALAGDRRAAWYFLPLPIAGAGVSTYHLLVENGVVHQAQACLISAPGGCATKWINEFGYVTIPTLALTGFVLTFAFLLASCFEPKVRVD